MHILLFTCTRFPSTFAFNFHFICSAFEICLHTLRANCGIQKVNSSADCTLETNTTLSELCQLTNDTRLWIFTALIAITLFLYIIRAVLIYSLTINSSRVLHNRMFASVLRAPARFFDTNPSGEGICLNCVHLYFIEKRFFFV